MAIAGVEPVCVQCRYRRQPTSVQLFESQDLTNPEVARVAREVDEWNRNRADRESTQYVASRRLIDYRPVAYAWCDRYTALVNTFFDDTQRVQLEQALAAGIGMARTFINEVVTPDAVAQERDLQRSAKAGNPEAVDELSRRENRRRHPVTGKMLRYHVLAEYMNSDRRCPLYRPRGVA